MYIDPNTGGILFQALAGVFAAGIRVATCRTSRRDDRARIGVCADCHRGRSGHGCSTYADTGDRGQTGRRRHAHPVGHG